MRQLPLSLLLVAVLCLVGSSASAHLSYVGKDYGTYAAGSLTSKTITGQTAEGNSGWADGTDADWGFTHYQTYFKFTLQATMTISINVTALDATKFLPGYSIYKGLGSTNPPDYDEEGSNTAYYLSMQPGEPKEGAFRALNTWKMGNDNSSAADFSDFSTFTYMGHAVDGTSANFGTVAGIVGDGKADGSITKSFTLGAGSYTVVIGGANYYTQNDLNYYGFNTTFYPYAVPEPTSAVLLSLGGLLASSRRQRSQPPGTSRARMTLA